MVPLVSIVRVLEVYGNETEQGRKVRVKATDAEGQSGLGAGPPQVWALGPRLMPINLGWVTCPLCTQISLA